MSRRSMGVRGGSAAAVADLEEARPADVVVTVHAVGLEAVPAVEVPGALVLGEDPQGDGCLLADGGDHRAHQVPCDPVAPGAGIEVDRVDLPGAAARRPVAAR